MSFCLTGDLTQSCGVFAAGGVPELYIAPLDAVASVTIDADGKIDAITMETGGYFRKFFPYDETGSFTETLTGEAPNTSYEQVINGSYRVRTQEKRNAIDELRKCACGLVAIWQEMSGERFIMGLTTAKLSTLGQGFPARLTGNVGETGAALGDINQETITLTAKNVEKARALDSALVVPLEP